MMQLKTQGRYYGSPILVKFEIKIALEAYLANFDRAKNEGNPLKYTVEVKYRYEKNMNKRPFEKTLLKICITRTERKTSN